MSVAYVEVKETHAAVIFLIGDRAYKVKKPVDLGFLDFSTYARRRAAIDDELALNRRLAPDVYLGVSDVTDVDGLPMERLLVMRRMPEDRRLAHLVRSGTDVREELRGVADLLAGFHERCARGPEIDADGTVEALRGRWRANLEAARPFVGTTLDRSTYDEVAAHVESYLDGRSALFEARLAEGAVVDGHGDLHADDIFLLDDGPKILDCLEFDEHLRHLDRLDDVCALAMSLEWLDAPEAAGALLDAYRAAAGDRAPESLVHHFVAYRAFVRSLVACLPGASDPDSAADLLALAHRHLRQARVRLVLVGGAPGTGKTTVARGLGEARGWTVLRSDETRKALAGLDSQTSASAADGEGIYTSDWTRRTYEELIRKAEDLLTLGESVILDASWSEAAWRSHAATLAARTSSELIEMMCVAPESVAAERIDRRRGDASDADRDVAAAMRARFDAWPSAVVVDTERPPARILDEVEQVVD